MTKQLDEIGSAQTGSSAGAATAALAHSCAECGAASPADHKFCGGCGSALYQACVQCGGSTRIGEAFCGMCGAHQEEAYQQRREALENELRYARELADQARFEEALSTVQSLQELTHHRMMDIAEAACRFSDKTQHRQQEAVSQSEHVLDEARTALDEGRWKDALSTIAHIPAALRGEEHESIQAAAQEAVEELTVLKQQIQSAVAAKETGGLLPKVQRALELEPGNVQLLRASEQLRRRQKSDQCALAVERLKQAKQLLETFQYREAQDLMAMVSADVFEDPRQQERAEQFRARVDELATLWESLRFSPYADEDLLKLSARMQSLAPNDQRIEKVQTQLRQRLGQNKSVRSVRWAKAPSETAVGCRVKLLRSLGCIDVSIDQQPAPFRDGPARFYSACGAALQGLGKAAVATNLLPKAEGGLLSRFKKRPRIASVAWGIDIGGSALKVIRLAHEESTGKLTATAADVIDYPSPLVEATSQAQRNDLLAAAVKQFDARYGVKDEAVCITLPGAELLCRHFAVPPVEEKAIADLVKYEAKQQVPFPLDQLYWDYHVGQDHGGDGPAEAVLLAARRTSAEHYLNCFADHKIRLQSVQSDCVALYNFYAAAFSALDGNAAMPCEMLVDVGAANTNFAVVGAGKLWFRSVGHGGIDITRALMNRFQTEYSKAEKAKLRPAAVKSIYSFHEACQPAFEKILKSVRQSIDAFEAAHRGCSIETVLCCGGGMSTFGIQRHLLGV